MVKVEGAKVSNSSTALENYSTRIKYSTCAMEAHFVGKMGKILQIDFSFSSMY